MPGICLLLALCIRFTVTASFKRRFTPRNLVYTHLYLVPLPTHTCTLYPYPALGWYSPVIRTAFGMLTYMHVHQKSCNDVGYVYSGGASLLILNQHDADFAYTTK
jgi:hypothetical protein